MVLNDKAVYKKNTIETDVYEYKSMGALSFTKDDVTRWLPLLKWLLVPIWLGWGAYFFIEKFFNTLVVALAGLVLGAIIGVKPRFGALYKMSLFAMTLSFLIGAVNTGIGFRIPGFELSYYGTGLVYLWLGLQALKNQTAPAAAPPTTSTPAA